MVYDKMVYDKMVYNKMAYDKMAYDNMEYGDAAGNTSTIALFRRYRASKDVWFFTSGDRRMY